MNATANIDRPSGQKKDNLFILRPWSIEEAIDVKGAAAQAGVSPLTMRDWASKKNIGRVVAGRVWISRVALAAYLDGDAEALSEYQRGCRSTPRVAAYFRRLGIPIVEQIKADG